MNQLVQANSFLDFVEGTLGEISYTVYDLSGNRSADFKGELIIARRQAYYGKTYRPANHRLNPEDKDAIEAYSVESLKYLSELKKSQTGRERDYLGSINSFAPAAPDHSLVSAFGTIYTGQEANRLKFNLLNKSFLFFLARQDSAQDQSFPLKEIKNNAAMTEKLYIAGYLATINELLKNDSSNDNQIQKLISVLSGEKRARAILELQKVKVIARIQQIILNNIWSLEASDPIRMVGKEMLKAGYFILEDKFLKLAETGAEVREVIRLAESESQKNRGNEVGSHFYWKSKTEPFRYLQASGLSCRIALSK